MNKRQRAEILFKIRPSAAFYSGFLYYINKWLSVNDRRIDPAVFYRRLAHRRERRACSQTGFARRSRQQDACLPNLETRAAPPLRLHRGEICAGIFPYHRCVERFTVEEASERINMFEGVDSGLSGNTGDTTSILL